GHRGERGEERGPPEGARLPAGGAGDGRLAPAAGGRLLPQARPGRGAGRAQITGDPVRPAGGRARADGGWPAREPAGPAGGGRAAAGRPGVAQPAPGPDARQDVTERTGSPGPAFPWRRRGAGRYNGAIRARPASASFPRGAPWTTTTRRPTARRRVRARPRR